MKDLCITKEQSIGIHDAVNDQGQPFGSLPVYCERINTAFQSIAKGMDWLLFLCLMFQKKRSFNTIF